MLGRGLLAPPAAMEQTAYHPSFLARVRHHLKEDAMSCSLKKSRNSSPARHQQAGRVLPRSKQCRLHLEKLEDRILLAVDFTDLVAGLSSQLGILSSID